MLLRKIVNTRDKRRAEMAAMKYRIRGLEAMLLDLKHQTLPGDSD